MNVDSRLALLVAALVLLSACTINSTRSLPLGEPARADRSVVVFGVKVEGQWDHPQFPLELTEYNVVQQAISGNCFRFNRIYAALPVTPGPTRYFAFEVPPGAYAYSPFNTAPLDSPVQAFFAPAGHTVFVGEFAYGVDRKVALRRNVAGAADAIRQNLPQLGNPIELAAAETVRAPRAFLCTP